MLPESSDDDLRGVGADRAAMRDRHDNGGGPSDVPASAGENDPVESFGVRQARGLPQLG